MRRLGQFGMARQRGFITGVALAAAVIAPLSAYAGHQFSDVPDTHPFHREIAAVAGAGITTGFADGTFKPGSNVTRQAMAAFFERGGSRVAYGDGDALLDAGQTATVASATIEAGATQAGNGLLHLIGSADASIPSTGVARCPCLVRFDILSPSNIPLASRHVLVPGLVGDGGIAAVAGTVQAVVPIAADRTQTYRLLASTTDTDVIDLGVTGGLTATYEPFSGDGDGTLDRQLTCPADDGYEDNDALAQFTTMFVDSSETLAAIACGVDRDFYRTSRPIGPGDSLEGAVAFSHAEGDINVCLHRGSTTLACTSSTDDEHTFSISPPAGTPTDYYTVEVRLSADTGSYPGNRYTVAMSSTSSVTGTADGLAAPAPAGQEVR